MVDIPVSTNICGKNEDICRELKIMSDLINVKTATLVEYERNSLFSVFNGILNFVGYIKAKPSLSKNSSRTVGWRISGFILFPRVLVRK